MSRYAVAQALCAAMASFSARSGLAGLTFESRAKFRSGCSTAKFA
jgi:hypothetical protein